MQGFWAVQLEESAPAVALGSSIWAYPLVNAGHILGVALLIGGSLPLSLRLLGLWKTMATAPLRKILSITADTGLALALVFGFLLFITRASSYIRSGFFLSKMVVLAVSIALTVLLRVLTAEKRVTREYPGGIPPPSLRLTAGALLILWPTVLTLGRLIGYF